MLTLAWILGSTLLVSGVSLIGALLLTLKEGLLGHALRTLVGFASGALIGGAFFHLLPESLATQNEGVFTAVVLGIVVFFLLEKSLWRHCHERECKVHPFAYLNLLGDGVHNFVDGATIAAGFLSSNSVGLIATLAVLMHEIPQELGDFGVLLYGGFGRAKAIIFNMLSALLAVAGALITYFLIPYLPDVGYVLAFSAGSFIYIAASDLIPELHKGTETKSMVLETTVFLCGILFIWLL
jgi:zinc and cadmium transporter